MLTLSQIPYQTVSGTPLPSILTTVSDPTMGPATVYVISCPTDSPQCALATNLTVTEGPSTARYVAWRKLHVVRHRVWSVLSPVDALRFHGYDRFDHSNVA